MRSLLAGVRALRLSTEQVGKELGITARRVRDLYRAYLEACAVGAEATWEPGRSGGDHRKAIPADVADLWRRMLTVPAPAPYAFVASETNRLFHFDVDRATVRRWARANGYAHPARVKVPQAAVRRWQCAKVGALWQLDMTPHAWFGHDSGMWPLLDLVDDCSRVVTGARMYPRECLLAYLDFLSCAFQEYGLPSALYVDYHSFFFTHVPGNRTYLSEALQHYGIGLKYAPTPQAKGKVERLHQFWQNRLPSYFQTHNIGALDAANPRIDLLRLHHNKEETHRELRMTPDEAWQRSQREGRSEIRPFREDPWWRYIWSVRTRVRVALDGTVPIGHLRQRVPVRPGGWALHCRHPDGSISLLANEPASGGSPIVLFRYTGSGPDWTV